MGEPIAKKLDISQVRKELIDALSGVLGCAHDPEKPFYGVLQG
jgi:hypothetical protein